MTSRGRAASPTPSTGLLSLYLIDLDSDSVVVHAATATGRWLRHSRHRLDPDQPNRALGCGGYTNRGHHWRPATIRLPGPPEAVFAADTCPRAAPGQYPRRPAHRPRR